MAITSNNYQHESKFRRSRSETLGPLGRGENKYGCSYRAGPENLTFLLQMGGYAFPTLLLKDLEGNTTVVPVNEAIEEGLIIMPGKLPYNPKS